ncbi:hypothetical protein MCOR25_002632 [Pyricularia grisea]|nr:hypothetical protein MCOR25_002632 [Pyricularia grisea]
MISTSQKSRWEWQQPDRLCVCLRNHSSFLVFILFWLLGGGALASGRVHVFTSVTGGSSLGSLGESGLLKFCSLSDIIFVFFFLSSGLTWGVKRSRLTSLPLLAMRFAAVLSMMAIVSLGSSKFWLVVSNSLLAP